MAKCDDTIDGWEKITYDEYYAIVDAEEGSIDVRHVLSWDVRTETAVNTYFCKTHTMKSEIN